MATIPEPLMQQMQLQPGVVTLLYTVPDTFSLGTASVELTNFSTSAANDCTIWHLPAGATTPEPFRRIAFTDLNSKGAQLIRFGIPVGPNHRFYVQTGGNEVNAVFYAVAHPKA